MQRSSVTGWRWRSLVCAVGGLFMCHAAAADPVADIARLTNLVRQDCGGCHGLTLKGGLGKPLTREHLSQWNEDQLMNIILDGVPGTPMPGWRPLITEAEARWIAGVLKEGSLQ